MPRRINAVTGRRMALLVTIMVAMQMDLHRAVEKAQRELCQLEGNSRAKEENVVKATATDGATEIGWNMTACVSI